MREIKFRGVFLNHIDHSFSHFQYWGLNLLGDGSHQWLGSNSSSYHKVSQQFTGLYDKNGKEIYEGDILSSYYHLEKGKPNHAPVVYKNGAFTWHGKPLGYDEEALEPSSTDWSIITGNIYENPELIDTNGQ